LVLFKGLGLIDHARQMHQTGHFDIGTAWIGSG
jgi:hypothetical protein